MPSIQRHNVTLSGLGQPCPCGPDTCSAHGLFLWPVPLSACSFSWQMFHTWYLQHPEVSSTIWLHLHGVPHCLLRGCLQGIWPCMVHIALFHRLLSGNLVQSFMTPVTACLQNQHHVDSTKFCWEVVRLSCIMIQSITTLSYTVLCQQGPQELLSVQVLLLQALGALSPLLSHRNVSAFSLVMLISARKTAIFWHSLSCDFHHSHPPLFYAWTTIVHSQMMSASLTNEAITLVDTTFGWWIKNTMLLRS